MTNTVTVTETNNAVTVTETNNAVTVTESNNTVQILESAPVTTADPWYANLGTFATSSGSATVTADSTSHTKGAWTEIIASNGAETSALFVVATAIGASATATATLIDIGVGASGSESAIAENIAVGGAGSIGIYFVVPVNVASGARISVRSQAVIASDTASISIDTFVMGDVSTVPTTVDVLGTSTATSAGTAIAETYTEVVASTSQEYKAIVVIPSASNNRGYSTNQTLTVATGSAGNETDIATQLWFFASSEIFYLRPWAGSVTANTIAAGTRLSAIRSSNPRNCDVTIIGIPAA